MKREVEVESVCKKFKKNFYPGLVDDLEVFADAPAGEMRHRRRSASQADLTLPPSKVGAFNPESPSFDQEAKDFVEKQADEIKRLKAENEKQEELLRLKKNFRPVCTSSSVTTLLVPGGSTYPSRTLLASCTLSWSPVCRFIPTTRWCAPQAWTR